MNRSSVNYVFRSKKSASSLSSVSGGSHDAPQPRSRSRTSRSRRRIADASGKIPSHSTASLIPDLSYESVAMRRHLLESKRVLRLPPVCTFLCVVFIVLYLIRDKLHLYKDHDINVSWDLVREGQYWRLLLAQFLHFNKLHVLVNCFTLFTLGRFLERKVTAVAVPIVIFMISSVSHLVYLTINSWFCETVQPRQVVFGFGNIIYGLRVLLAYAIEPRNHELDLVYGLYPMVVSASHAPWQPILDLIIFKIVVPEQCVTRHVSGIVAGFIVTWALLLWPTGGIWILAEEALHPSMNIQFSTANSPTNALKRKSDILKQNVSEFFHRPRSSLIMLMANYRRKNKRSEEKRLRRRDKPVRSRRKRFLEDAVTELIELHRRRKSRARRLTRNESNMNINTSGSSVSSSASVRNKF